MDTGYFLSDLCDRDEKILQKYTMEQCQRAANLAIRAAYKAKYKLAYKLCDIVPGFFYYHLKLKISMLEEDKK